MKKVKNVLLYALILTFAACFFASCASMPGGKTENPALGENTRTFGSDGWYNSSVRADGYQSTAPGPKGSGGTADKDSSAVSSLDREVLEEHHSMLEELLDALSDYDESGPPMPTMPGESDMVAPDSEYVTEIFGPSGFAGGEGSVSEPVAPVPPAPPAKPVKKPGQLTAGEWNDLRNHDFWKTLFELDEQAKTQSVFYGLPEKWGLETRNMIPVNIVSKGRPVQGAKVQLFADDGTLLYSAVSDAAGNAYLFPATEPQNFRVVAESAGYRSAANIIFDPDFVSTAANLPGNGNTAGAVDIPPASNGLVNTITMELEDFTAKKAAIELMFVIDTTGSMGDEIAYLKAEMVDVIERAVEATGAVIRLALLLYKDIGDVYVTRYYDFTTDLAAQQAVINTVTASGGGDFPEAVDIALSEMVSKNWSDGNTTKLVFHVLDAPPHDRPENIALFRESILKAAELGIRLIPVASSGIDKETEFLLRSEAMLTGGTYTFLTADSGIGGAKIKPTTGAYVVEYLNEQMLRLIKEFYTGVSEEPVPWQGK
ncbi:MAG: VWA domain-containing protein [Firmicutes bacterium]|nr:VWA domain-containing protein [Bacillota bacterium]